MGSAPEPVLDEQVRQSARSSEPDRYLSALLAPRPACADLIALAAFMGEVGRVSHLVREPVMGQIRLQWWRDALDAGLAGGATGSPVADALCQTITRHRLPQELVHCIIDAREHELEPELPIIGEGLDRYLDETEGAALRLAGRVLGVPSSTAADDLLRAAGRAYGRVRLMQALPLLVAKGHGVPAGSVSEGGAGPASLRAGAKHWLKEVRRLIVGAPSGLLPAVLPVALVEPYLTVLEGAGSGMDREPADISPLTRVWKLWIASMRGRV